jgi:hypothetical protein
VGTVIHSTQRRKDDRPQRWDRLERADRCEQESALHIQGRSQRHAATVLEVPRSPLQAWRPDQEPRDESPAGVAFFQSVAGLAFLHRLVLAVPLGCVESGAWGMRLGCLFLKRTGLTRCGGAS